MLQCIKRLNVSCRVESFVITLLDAEKNEIEPVYILDLGKRIPVNAFHLEKG